MIERNRTDRILVDDAFGRWFKAEAKLRRKTHPEFSKDLFRAKDAFIKEFGRVNLDEEQTFRPIKDKRGFFNDWGF